MEEEGCKGCACQDCETDCECLNSMDCSYCTDGSCYKESCKNKEAK